MAIDRAAIEQERTSEAQLDEALAAHSEKAAQALRERDEQIADLQRENNELGGTLSAGSTARAARIARKQNALNALKAVLPALLVAIALAWGLVALQERLSPETQFATGEPGNLGFLMSSAG